MIIKTASNNIELGQILELQNKNLKQNLNPSEKIKSGFVTVKHDMKTLTAMKDSASQIIAVSENKVIAYALSMTTDQKTFAPLLSPLFESLNNLTYSDKYFTDIPYYVMGQICIGKKFRRQGISQLLYEKHREIFSSYYDLCITEVSASNVPSLHAHKKIGFETIKEYTDQTDHWHIMIWDWN